MANWFTKRLNGKGADPAALADALEELNAKRAEAQRMIKDLDGQRVQALRDQDFKAAEKLLRERRDAENLLEGLALSEPELVERLSTAQRAARQTRWRVIRETALAAATETVAAGRLAWQKTLNYVALLEQARREGFEREIASLPVLPTVGSYNLVCSLELLEQIESAIEASSSVRTQPKTIAAPASPAQPKAAAQTGLQHAVGLQGGVSFDATLLRAKRAPDDIAPLRPGEARVVAIRSFSPRDDLPQVHAGQKYRTSIDEARSHARHGLGEIIEQFAPPAAAAILGRGRAELAPLSATSSPPLSAADLDHFSKGSLTSKGVAK